MTVPAPPAPQEPSRPGGSKVPLVVAIAITGLLLVGVGVTALVLALTGPQSPEDGVRELVEATVSGDCEVLVTHPVTQLESVAECEKQIAEGREAAEDADEDYDSFTLEVERIDVLDESEDDAVLLVDLAQSYTVDGEEQTEDFTREYTLTEDDGHWYVVTEKNATVNPKE